MPDPVIAGSNLYYTLVVTNLGPSDVVSAGFGLVLPPGLTTNALEPGWFVETNFLATGIDFLFGPLTNLAAGGASTQVVVCLAVDPSKTASISNAAFVGSLVTDPNPEPLLGLFGGADTQETAVITSADLKLFKSDSPDPAVAGSNDVAYTITVTNCGPSDALNVQVTDTHPAGVTPAGPTITNLGAVTAGAAKSFELTVAVNASTLGTITNVASVQSSTTDPNGINNTNSAMTLVQDVADLKLFKTDAPDPVVGSNALVYTLTATNCGPSDARNVTITDTLPAGVTPPGPVVTNLGTLTPGQGASVVIAVQTATNTTGVITNTASVTTLATDPDAANDTAQADTTIPDFDGDGEADFSDPDDDNDGIPDTYEIMFGLNPTNAADGVLDNDLDGFSNFEEYVSDTDPTDAASFFDIDAVGLTNSVLLIFETSTGRVYTLQFNDNIESAIWSNFPGLIDIPGTGTNSFIDSNDVPRRFYRINVDLP
jgi:uncharacterized repeat protein (TIGR01451 family)